MTILGANQQILWQAQPGPQTALIECPVFEVLFGGARGGGKTEASLGDWMEHQQRYGKDANGVFFRREQVDLEEAIERAKELFEPLGAKWNENKHSFRFKNGARLKFRYLDKDKDAQKYQGHSYTRLYFEEVTQYPSPIPIMKLKATLRSRAGVPCGMRMTANPGGPGHSWVKSRYIDPNPAGFTIIKEEETIVIDGKEIKAVLDRVFIPSKITDNKMLLLNDPSYLMRLRASGSAQLVKAWLEGDWTVVDGAFFDKYDPFKHVLDSSEWLPRIPKRAPRLRAMDWGYAKPFSVGWYAISDGTWGLPEGAMVKYREWYGTKGENVGLKMNPDLVARGIMEREKGEIIQFAYADPQIFAHTSGISVAEQMSLTGVDWMPADNKREMGWMQIAYRLDGEEGSPMLYFLDNCTHTLRTFPQLQHDENRPEDIDSDGEDHAGDETRYACMGRVWYPKWHPEAPESMPTLPHQRTFQSILQMNKQARMREAANERLV